MQVAAAAANVAFQLPVPFSPQHWIVAMPLPQAIPSDPSETAIGTQLPPLKQHITQKQVLTVL